MEEQIAALQAQLAELNVQLKAAQDKANETDSLVAKARKEEKDKLYSEVLKVKEQLTASESKVKELEASLADKGNNTELETQVAAKEKEVAELKNQITELNTKLAEGADNVSKEQLDALLKSQEEMQKLIKEQADKIAGIEAAKAAEIAAKEVAVYKAEKLKDLDETFHAFVQGATKEEVDASYTMAKKAHEDFLKKNGFTNLKPTSISHEDTFKDVTAEEISRMTPKEYAEYRKKLQSAGVLK